MTALYLSMFLVALVSIALSEGIYLTHIFHSLTWLAQDRTILGTAIPQITDDFHSVGDVGWYGAAYLLTASAFQLIYGRIYTFYSPKWVLLCAIGIFEIGVCHSTHHSRSLTDQVTVSCVCSSIEFRFFYHW